MKTLVFAFGRMNPPTLGHQKLVDRVTTLARAHRADQKVYLSQSVDSSKNPLDWQFKVSVCQEAFPDTVISTDIAVKNPYHALELAVADGYTNIIMVAGADRIDEYTAGMQGYTDFFGVNFSVISAGRRNAESTGIDGISGSMMRQLASENHDYEFYKRLPTALSKQSKSNILKSVKEAVFLP